MKQKKGLVGQAGRKNIQYEKFVVQRRRRTLGPVFQLHSNPLNKSEIYRRVKQMQIKVTHLNILFRNKKLKIKLLQSKTYLDQIHVSIFNSLLIASFLHLLIFILNLKWQYLRQSSYKKVSAHAVIHKLRENERYISNIGKRNGFQKINPTISKCQNQKDIVLLHYRYNFYIF